MWDSRGGRGLGSFCNSHGKKGDEGGGGAGRRMGTEQEADERSWYGPPFWLRCLMANRRDEIYKERAKGVNYKVRALCGILHRGWVWFVGGRSWLYEIARFGWACDQMGIG